MLKYRFVQHHLPVKPIVGTDGSISAATKPFQSIHEPLLAYSIAAPDILSQTFDCLSQFIMASTSSSPVKAPAPLAPPDESAAKEKKEVSNDVSSGNACAARPFGMSMMDASLEMVWDRLPMKLQVAIFDRRDALCERTNRR